MSCRRSVVRRAVASPHYALFWPSLAIALLLDACGGPEANHAATRDAEDPDPVFTPEHQVAFAELSPQQLPAPPPDESNRFADDPSAAALGQRFFFDPAFAGKLLDGDNDGSVNALGQQGETGKVACSGCHVPKSAFTDTRSIRAQISLAAGWGRRRAPSLLDIGHSRLLMWDGRRDSLFSQVFAVIESPVEMNSSRLYVAQQLFARYRDDYESIFGAMPALDDAERFPTLSAEETGCQQLDANNLCTHAMRGAPGDGAEFDSMAASDQREVTRVVANFGKALGAYQRLLSCGPSRFDRWVQGDASALSREEQRGAVLFVGTAGCISCHSGPFFSDEKFHNVGLRAQRVATAFLNANDRGAGEGLPPLLSDPLNVRSPFSDGDDGRIPDEVSSEMEGAFRTPRLRCVSQRPSFMHTGQLTELEDVVSFFNNGGENAGYPGTNELTPLHLSQRERADLLAFLRALDGPGASTELRAEE